MALVLIWQFLEDLTDRQAAEAVRGRIAWKYALGLPLDDAGFDASVLSKFRPRLVTGGQEAALLEAMLARFRDRDRSLVRAGGRQRTDSTHILAAVRGLHRVECVAETLRHTLNLLATGAPHWLRALLDPAWVARYARRQDDFRLPKAAAAPQALAETIGTDGVRLLMAIDAASNHSDSARPASGDEAAAGLDPAVLVDGRRGRPVARPRRHPPAGTMFNSLYDHEARSSTKRTTSWIGDNVHVTETCEPTAPTSSSR